MKSDSDTALAARKVKSAWSRGIARPVHWSTDAKWRIFVRSGDLISKVIWQQITLYFGPGSRPRTLDFGCGFGRVFLPLYFADRTKLSGCDVNPTRVRYLRKIAQRSSILQTSYTPPLPYEDGAFDCVYSVSIWTHLPDAAGRDWLGEIRRILRPGGLALITVSNFPSLERRRQKGEAGWVDVSDEELQHAGVLYREMKLKGNDIGITGSYGTTLHTADHVRNEWSKVMSVREIHPAVIGPQDLVVMVKD